MEFDVLADDFSLAPVGFDPVAYRFKRGLEIGGIVTEHGTSDDGLLMGVLQTQFGGGNIEFAAQAREQGFDLAAFFFQ